MAYDCSFLCHYDGHGLLWKLGGSTIASDGCSERGEVAGLYG